MATRSPVPRFVRVANILTTTLTRGRHPHGAERVLHRPSPPPPQRDPPAGELLRAIGVLQELGDGVPIAPEDLAILALESRISILNLGSYIDAEVAAGYLDVDEEEAIALTEKGWAWWRKRYADR